jgi:hypothetical protein
MPASLRTEIPLQYRRQGQARHTGIIRTLLAVSPSVQILSPLVETQKPLVPHNGSGSTGDRPGSRKVIMNKLLKRGLLAATALTIPAGAALALPMAAHAASPSKASPITVESLANLPSGTLSGTIKGNIDIPAGVTVFAGDGTTVTGNVTVEGTLKVAGATFDKNVTITGPESGLQVINQGMDVAHNLIIVGSSGVGGQNGFYNDAGVSHIGGTFSYLDDPGNLYVGLNGGPTGTVAKNFVAVDSPSLSLPGLTVTGFSNVATATS